MSFYPYIQDALRMQLADAILERLKNSLQHYVFHQILSLQYQINTKLPVLSLIVILLIYTRCFNFHGKDTADAFLEHLKNSLQHQGFHQILSLQYQINPDYTF